MLYSHRFRWPVLGLMLSALLLSGCELFNGGDDDDDVRGSDRIGQTDTGVPATASRVEEGRGELSYRAEANGTVYLYDADGQLHLDTQKVRRGQVYTIDPSRSIATLNGEVVWQRTMDPKHSHRIYFDRARD